MFSVAVPATGDVIIDRSPHPCSQNHYAGIRNLRPSVLFLPIHLQERHDQPSENSAHCRQSVAAVRSGEASSAADSTALAAQPQHLPSRGAVPLSHCIFASPESFRKSAQKIAPQAVPEVFEYSLRSKDSTLLAEERPGAKLMEKQRHRRHSSHRI